MAEEPSVEQQILPTFERWYRNALSQLAAFSAERQAIYAREQRRLDSGEHRAGLEAHTPAEHAAFIHQGFTEALGRMREDRAWRDSERSPAYQAWERERARDDALDVDRAGDPDSLGAQAEQRFSAEQDPTSQWYRADRSHGEPGPDVARARAETLRPEDMLREAIQTGYDEGYPLLPAQIASIRSRLSLGEAEAGPGALPALQERLAALLDQVTDRTQERHRDQGLGY
jgi:hypothetical protein